MMFKTHLALGLFASLLVVNFLSLEHPLVFVLLATLLSGLPDMDTEKSVYGRKLWPFSWMIRFVFGHRGFFHSLFPPLIGYLVLAYFGWSFLGGALLVGDSAHLVGDALTMEGIAFLYPFSKFRISGFLITGGFAERMVFVFLVAVDLVLGGKWMMSMAYLL